MDPEILAKKLQAATDAAIGYVQDHYITSRMMAHYIDNTTGVRMVFDLAIYGDQSMSLSSSPYLFDVLDVPAHIRDPDFIRAIIDKCFDRGVLKPKYSDRRYVCENAKDAIRINLDETLVKICYRTIKFGPKYCV